MTCRRNLIVGTKKPFGLSGPEHMTRKLLKIEDNCMWLVGGAGALSGALKYINSRGKGKCY